MSADESRPAPRPEPVYDPGAAGNDSDEAAPARDVPYQESAGWGAPAQPRTAQGWSTRKMVAAVAIAVVVAAGGGAAVYAGTNAASAQAAGTSGSAGDGQNSIGGPDGDGGPGGSGDGDLGPGGLGAGLQSAVHGEYVVESNGSYVTMLTQTGEVTAVSATSLTVRSADGVTRTFTVNSSTTVSNRPAMGGRMGARSGSASISDVTKGSKVRVTATKSGSTPAATAVDLVTSTAATAN
ncbi:hypothetical protein KIH31_13215 [Paenarthrobacter sp. DKR-5]|uniref:hypothetical protein n=1 Tax=Paenarthrobacter sp. DKR-5 TaxID=2835535 RepID=UPI001BDD6E35|nr:hypothetical protein [Paenarthrobacter sp. DKR-5]MBT1003564.1 hypothetical protein [Paenarthrobacter sp. DKR-5]